MSPERLALTLGTLAFAGVVYALMLKGWRGRQRRQADLPAPPAAPAPRGRVVVGAVPGLFVGTVVAGDWLDRVAVHRLSDRATCELVVTADGVHLDRDDLPELFLPLDAVEEVAVGDRLAGKVMGAGGLLLLTWRLGDRLLTSAFRATDHAQHQRLADAVHALLPVRTDRTAVEETSA
jgi:hypothetical protein